MKLFNSVKNYIGENKFRLIIYNDKIDIVNFEDINDINDNKIVVKSDNKIVIEGKNLKVKKLVSKEALITGEISKIYFNE